MFYYCCLVVAPILELYSVSSIFLPAGWTGKSGIQGKPVEVDLTTQTNTDLAKDIQSAV